MKELIFFIFLFSLTSPAVSPDLKYLLIIESVPLEPYSKLIHAIGMVEGMSDTTAYNEFEMAAGFFQIRPIRLEEYNKRSGNNLLLTDMFSYEISRKVFLYFAVQIGPYDFEKIARTWNGSGAKTTEYWKRIQQYL
jgi:hypothetical protein